MATQFGPIELDCDALPYPIVQACERLGFRAPLDVRWCRLSRFLSDRAAAAGLLGGLSWSGLFHRGQRPGTQCTCGESLPSLEQYTFMYLSGTEAEYRLGQCEACNTMFWDEVPAAF